MLTAPFLLTRYAWPHMKRQQWGRVVNIASIHGLVASPNKIGYISAKHGLLGLTKTAALEGGAHGITVNALCPAYVRTPLVEGQIVAQAKAHNIAEEAVIAEIMLKPAAIKKIIEPDEIADIVLLLCSERGASITGACWTIDCGWSTCTNSTDNSAQTRSPPQLHFNLIRKIRRFAFLHSLYLEQVSLLQN